MNFEMSPADDDYAIVANLARFYIYDMAEHAGWHFPESGLFDAEDHFASYWNRAGGKKWPPEWRGLPFLIRVEGHPAGFALVKQMSAASYDMGEFFIGRQHRRRGLGQHAATALFDQFKGNWEVREMPTNVAAQAFWRRIIGQYTHGAFTDTREKFAAYQDREFIVQRFRS